MKIFLVLSVASLFILCSACSNQATAVDSENNEEINTVVDTTDLKTIRDTYLLDLFLSRITDTSWENPESIEPDAFIVYAICKQRTAPQKWPVSGKVSINGEPLVDANEFESTILSNFDVPIEHLHKSQFYFKDNHMYEIFGLGSVSNCIVTNAEQNGDNLIIQYQTFHLSVESGRGTLIIQLQNDGFKYLSNEYEEYEMVLSKEIRDLSQSVNYDPDVKELSFKIPLEATEGYMFYISIDTWPETGGSVPEQLTDFNNNEKWELGREYVAVVSPDEFETLLIMITLKDNATSQLLMRIPVLISSDGNVVDLSETQS